MSNSTLATYKQLSPNCTMPRKGQIKGVAIHCTAGSADSTAATIAAIFSQRSRGASCNYAIGGDGSIALVVAEANRAWCTSSIIDHNVISIEVASDTTGNTVRPAAVSALIRLLVDICERNGIKRLLWTGRKEDAWTWERQNMVVHRWFANKSCPGDYLYSLHPEIAAKVNALLDKEADSVDEAEIKALIEKHSKEAIREAAAEMAAQATSHWAQDALTWAMANGITDGAKPGAYCTREQVVTMLYRLAKVLAHE